jgi:hypothetical protein
LDQESNQSRVPIERWFESLTGHPQEYLGRARRGRWAVRYAAEKAAVRRMEFKAFVTAFVRMPGQVVRTSRRLGFRLLAWNPWQAVFLRGVDQLHQLRS